MKKPDWKDAPEWADLLMQLGLEYYWCNVEQFTLAAPGYNNIKFGGESKLTIGDFQLVEMRPDPWSEGKERMENIVRNAGEGEHYDELLPTLDEFLGIKDNVNHPEHYQSDNGIECIDAIRAALGHDGFIAYCRGNAIKYNWRSGSKSSHSEDLKKGAWYSNRAAEKLEKSK
jgi:hypothetical protein